MGLFSDIWDVVTAPISAVADVVLLPVNIAADIVSGKNVFGSALDEVKKSVGATARLAGGTTGELWSTDKGQEILKSDFLNKATLGYSGDYAGTLKAAQNLNETGGVTTEQFQSSAKFFGKTAAIGAGAGAFSQGLTVGGHTVTLTEGLSAVSVGSALARGDTKSVLTSLGVPEGVADQFGSVNNFFAPTPQAGPAQAASARPTVSEAASTGGGKISPTDQALGKYLLPTVMVVGVAYVALKGRSRG